MWNLTFVVEHNVMQNIIFSNTFFFKCLFKCCLKNWKLSTLFWCIYLTQALFFSLSDLRPREVWPDVWKLGSYKGQHIQAACKYSHSGAVQKLQKWQELLNWPHVEVLVGLHLHLIPHEQWFHWKPIRLMSGVILYNHTTQCTHCYCKSSTSPQVTCYCVSLQFPRVRDTSFTGVTVEECKVILSGMDPLLFTLDLLKHSSLQLICFFFSIFRKSATDGWWEKGIVEDNNREIV